MSRLIEKVFCLFVVLALAAGDCDATWTDGPVVCETCPSEADVNAVSNLPRLNRRAESVSSNLVNFDLVLCYGDDSPNAPQQPTDGCKFHMSMPSNPLDIVTTGSEDPKSIYNYAEGVLGYVLFGIAAAVFCCIFIFCYVCGRMCCCCQRGGCCGKRYPTYAFKWWHCGFEEVDAPLLSKGGVKELAYPQRSRWCTRLVMLLYVVGVAGFVSVGQLRGNLALTDGMTTISQSPKGLMYSVVSIGAPLTNGIVSVASEAIYPFFSRLNHTVQTTVDIRSVVQYARQVTNGVRTSLPDPVPLLAFVDNSSALAAEVETTALALRDNLNDINSTLTATMPVSAALLENLLQLQTGVAGIGSTANVTIDATFGAQDFIANMTDPNDGLPTVMTELDLLIAHTPRQQSAASASQGTNSLQQLIMGGIDGKNFVEQRAILRQKLADIAGNITALPDLQLVVSHLRLFRERMLTFRNDPTVNMLHGSVVQLNDYIGGLPRTPVLNETLRALQQSLLSINVSGIIQNLESLNETVSTKLPNVTTVRVQLDKLANIQVVIDAMSNLLDAVRPANETIVSLPAQFDDIEQMLRDVNQTYTEASANVNDMEGKLDEVDNLKSVLPAITDGLTTTRDVQQQLENPPIDFDAVDAQLVSANASLSSLDLLTTADAIVAANASLWSPDVLPQEEDIDAVESLSSVMSVLLQVVEDAITQLDKFSNFRRCEWTNTECTVDGSTAPPCTGATVCSGAVRSCTLDWTQFCMQDSDCGPGQGSCPFNVTAFAIAQNVLDAYAASNPDPAIDDLAVTAEAAAAANASIAALPSIPGLRADMASMLDTLNALPVDSSISSVEDMRSKLNPSYLELPSVNDTISDVIETLAAVDFAAARQVLEDFQSTIADVKAQTDSTLTTVDNVVTQMETFFFTSLPSMLPRLSRVSLDAAVDANGLEGVLRQIAGVAQEAIDFINDAVNATGMADSVVSLNVEELLDDNIGSLDMWTDPNITQYGPVQFFARMLPGIELVTPQEYTAAGGGDVFTRANDARWAGGRYCLTSECIANTISRYNTQKLKIPGFLLGRSAAEDMEVGLSREELMFLPYIIPILICLIGFLPAAFSCGKSWHSCAAATSSFCICITLPFIFLFAVALSFPMLMLAADGCRSGINLGYKFVHGSESNLCDMLPDAVYIPDATGGTDGVCQFSVQGQPMQLQLSKLYSALLGDCANAPLVLPNLFDSVGSALERIPSSFANDTMDNFVNGDAEVRPRQTVVDIFQRFGVDAGNSLSGTISELKLTLTCDTLNRNISAITSGMCCDFMTALYWFVSSWCFIAFCMCICGFPASICGYKRFPNRLWGPDYMLRSNKTAAKVVETDLVDADLLRPTNDLVVEGEENAASSARADKPQPNTAPAASPPNSSPALQPQQSPSELHQDRGVEMVHLVPRTSLPPSATDINPNNVNAQQMLRPAIGVSPPTSSGNVNAQQTLRPAIGVSPPTSSGGAMWAQPVMLPPPPSLPPPPMDPGAGVHHQHRRSISMAYPVPPLYMPGMAMSPYSTPMQLPPPPSSQPTSTANPLRLPPRPA